MFPSVSDEELYLQAAFGDMKKYAHTDIFKNRAPDDVLDPEHQMLFELATRILCSSHNLGENALTDINENVSTYGELKSFVSRYFLQLSKHN